MALFDWPSARRTKRANGTVWNFSAFDFVMSFETLTVFLCLFVFSRIIIFKIVARAEGKINVTF